MRNSPGRMPDNYNPFDLKPVKVEHCLRAPSLSLTFGSERISHFRTFWVHSPATLYFQKVHLTHIQFR